MKKKISLYKPSLGLEEKNYVNDCLKSNWISSKGKYIKLFEKSFKNFTKINYCVSVTNGTCGLHLALLGLDLGQDDEVIVPSFTYIASVNCISYVNAKPVFVDINLKNWQANIENIKSKVTKKTKAILIPHLYGNVCDLDELLKLRKKFGLYIIEDCAEAVGSYYKKKHVGNFGDVSVFSFFGSKTITTGEGGMICSNNKNIINKINKLKGQGLKTTKDKKYYWHDVVGYNYRMTNICAAIGYAQIKKIKRILKLKKNIYKIYKQGLSLKNIIFPETIKQVNNSHWLIVFRLKTPKLRDKLISFLNKKNIETRPTFYLVNDMDMYKKKIRLPNSKKIANNGICMPSHPNLSKSDIRYVINNIKNFLIINDK